MLQPRESFRRHLHALQDEALVLGSMVNKSIERSMEALKNRNLELAHQVVVDDAKINQKRFDIEIGRAHV
jgi:phosphate transport system protein